MNKDDFFWEGIYEFEEVDGFTGEWQWDCVNCGIVFINEPHEYDLYKLAPGHAKTALQANET